jgi:U3 small nucleolar RNA-associated protein MPP10
MPRKKKKSTTKAKSAKKQKEGNISNAVNHPKSFIDARAFLHDVANKPEEFYTKNESMSKALLACVKMYFDHAKKNANDSTSVIPGSELSELFVDGLDLEQIWEQINMQNIPIMKHYSMVLNDEELLNNINLMEMDDDDEEGTHSSDNEDNSASSSSSSSSDDDNNNNNSDGSDSEGQSDDQEEDDEEVSYNDMNQKSKNTRNNVQRKVTDDVDEDLKEKIKLNMEQDKFFNFEDFEKFADGHEDLGELGESVDIYESMYGDDNGDDSDEEGDNDDEDEQENNIGIAKNDDGDMSSSDEEFEDGIDLEKQGKALEHQNVKFKSTKKAKVNDRNENDEENVDNLTYSDFFGPNMPDDTQSKVEIVDRDAGEGDKDGYAVKKNKDNEEQPDKSSNSSSSSGSDSSSSSSDSGSDNDEEGESISKTTKLSRHAQYELEKKAEIEALEQEILQTKTWDMLGETSSRKRPENSLLEKDLDYQRTVKVAPTITEDVTQTIEDMIKQRIRDELWDDVERKIEDKNPKANRELDEVSTEKSKIGLGDIYAKEYEQNVLGNKSAKDIEKQKLHDEITGIWNELSSKLDAMSNYHFTPKPVVEDIQIKSNVSSIQMEEVLPMGVSAASRLAPEEVFKKKRGREGVLIGDDELGKDERARKRRAKKTARRKARKMKRADEKAIARINPGMGNKHAHKKMLETLASARNVTEGKTSDKVNYTKSSEFFNQLTNDVSMISSMVDKTNKKKKANKGTNSSSLKL